MLEQSKWDDDKEDDISEMTKRSYYTGQCQKSRFISNELKIMTDFESDMVYFLFKCIIDIYWIGSPEKYMFKQLFPNILK